MLNDVINIGFLIHTKIREWLEGICNFSHWELILIGFIVVIVSLINFFDIKISLYKLTVRLERSKIILFVLFFGTLLYNVMVYGFIYHLSFSMSLYYSLLQFIGGIAHPSSLGLSELNECWKIIYLGGFFSLLTTALLIILKFFNTWVYDSVRSKIVNEKDPHVIMCGFGINNRHIIDSILKIGKKKIIVLEKDINNPHIQDYREKGVVFILGDTTKEENLQRSGIKTCEYIIVSAGQDNINLVISQKIKNIIGQIKVDDKLKVYVHLENHLLERNFKDTFSHNFEVFSYNENAVRRLFKEKRLNKGVDTVNSNEQVHLIVVGLGGLGVSVVINAIKLGHFYNQQYLKITIIDYDASSFGKFKAYYDVNNIGDIDIEFKNYNVHSEKFHNEIILNKINATYIVFSLANDNDTLIAASSVFFNIKQSNKLNNQTKELPVIAVRLMNDSTLELEDEICVFGNNSEISDIKYIKDSTLDNTAKASHELYRNGHSNPDSIDIWEILPDSQKDKNRAVADNKSIRKEAIKSLGMSILKNLDKRQNDLLKDSSYKSYSMSMQKLIDMEKRRWNAYHIIEGWKNESNDEIVREWKATYKDEYTKCKIHICIVNTEELEGIGNKHDNNYFKNDWNQWRDLIKEEINNV